MKKQSGFAFVELILVAVVLAAVGFTAVTAYNHHKASTASTENAATPAPTLAPAAPAVTSSADLNTAQKAVDDTNVDDNSTDSTDLNSQSSGL